MAPWWERQTLEVAYAPLREGEIRLITFEDITHAAPEHHLGYHIQHVSINDPPPYCALSYRWPNGKELDEPAKFKDHWLDIRGGPLAAVRSYLSNANAADRHLPFWIDQFCIKQSDAAEMGKQVSLMREIYSKASKTVIFLGFPQGPGSEGHFRAAFDYLREISRDSSSQHPSKKKIGFTKKQPVGTVVALATVLAAPWFSRTWVVQEAVLSRNAVVLCGSNMEDMLQLCVAVSHFDRMGFLRHLFREFHTPEHPWQARVQKVRLFYHLKLSYATPQLHWSECLPRDAMKRLLARCRPLDATDRRDKIFGLAGICRAEDRPTVDYGLSDSQVYRRTAVKILNEGHQRHHDSKNPNSCPWNDLCLLALVNADSETIKSPSWIPDFSLPLTYNDLWFDSEEYLGFRACGSKTPHIEFPAHSPHKLIIEGKLCSTVSSIGEDSIQTRELPVTGLDECSSCEEWWPVSMGSDEGIVEQGRRLPEWILRAGDYLRENTGADPQREQRIARTLCAGARVETAWTPSATDGAATKRSRHAELWDMYRTLVPHLLGIDSLTKDDIGPESGGRDGRAYKKLLGMVGIPCRGRRLFVTSDGHMGLGPGRMREGDVVGVLYGAHWPFILRPHGDAYLLVGYCYVDGMMDGEMIERGDIPERPICLV